MTLKRGVQISDGGNMMRNNNIKERCWRCGLLKDPSEFKSWFGDAQWDCCRSCHKLRNHEKYLLQKTKSDYVKITRWKSKMRKAMLKRAGSHTPEEWRALKAKYHYTCPSCGRKEPEIKLYKDHVIPLVRGGSNTIKNIQPLCKDCNASKRTKRKRFAIKA